MENRAATAGLKGFFAMPGEDSAMAEDIIIEFHRVGAFVKVSAIDPRTLTEVSIVGDPAAGEEMLARAAVRKLEYVLARKGGGKAPVRGRPPA